MSDPSREVLSIMTLAGMERMVRITYSDGHEPPAGGAPTQADGRACRGAGQKNVIPSRRTVRGQGRREASSRQSSAPRARRAASDVSCPAVSSIGSVSSIEVVTPMTADVTAAATGTATATGSATTANAGTSTRTAGSPSQKQRRKDHER